VCQVRVLDTSEKLIGLAFFDNQVSAKFEDCKGFSAEK
jgi:hypothetical protein